MHFLPNPPLDHADEARRNVIKQKIFRHAQRPPFRIEKFLVAQQFVHILLETLDECLVALARQQSKNVSLIFLQMIQNVAKCRSLALVRREFAMRAAFVEQTPRNVIKQLTTERLEQRVFRLEVIIKRTAPDIRRVYDLPYGDVAIQLPIEQRSECFEDRRARFSLPSIRFRSLLQ